MNEFFGPSFVAELTAAGVAGLPFVWYPDGSITYGDSLTDQERQDIDAVVAAHDPSRPAPTTVPEEVTAYQARVTLTRHGLLEGVNEFFGALPEADERRLAWTYAATVQRNGTGLSDAAQALQLTGNQIDALFIEASKVQ